MKRFFLSVLALSLLFSCRDDEPYARFEPESYSFHYNDTVELKLVSSEDINLFAYYQNASNIDISPEGVVAGKYVGEAGVVAKHNDLSAYCRINVVPYENLYRMLPIFEKGMNRETIKLLEQGLGRSEGESSITNTLKINPGSEDKGLQFLEYIFEADKLTAAVANLNPGTKKENIDRFIEERYPLVRGVHEDVASGATVKYDETGNRIEYTW